MKQIILAKVVILFTLLQLLQSASAISINQIPPFQINKNTLFKVQVALEDYSNTVVWTKMYGPDWLNINSYTGVISGTSNSVGEAHYVQVKAQAEGEVAIMTFILVVGQQNIFWMTGQQGQPASIQEAYTIMQPGDVLIIPNGEYLSTSNAINGSSGQTLLKSGSEDHYTTLIAEQPNQVHLPYIYHRGMEYIAYKGLELATGLTIDGNTRFGVRSNHVKVMLSSAQSGGFSALNGTQDVLFEDCFAYGDSRAVFRVGSTGNPADRVIFRRCVARHDFTTNSNPTAMFMHYGGQNILWQNCLAIDQADNPANFAAAYERYGAWESKNGQNVYIKDSMAINITDEFHFGDSSTDNVRFSNSLFWDIGTGSTSRSANTLYDRLTIGEVDAQNTENTFTDRSGSASVYFTNSIFYDIEGTGTESGLRSKTILYQVDESENNLIYPLQSDIKFGDDSGIITHIDPLNDFNSNGITSLVYPIRVESNSKASKHNVGANIIYKRGFSGSLWGEQGYDDLSSQPLWPWPNEQQIKEKMAAFNYNEGSIIVNGARGFTTPKQSLSNYIWGYIGNTVPPFNVQVKGSNESAIISWDKPAEQSLENIYEFRVYNVTPEGDTLVAIVLGNQTYSTTINNLINGERYSFYVTAVDREKGESSYSYSVDVLVGPVVLTAPTITKITIQ